MFMLATVSVTNIFYFVSYFLKTKADVEAPAHAYKFLICNLSYRNLF